jgi:hypothetical protein
VLAATRPPCTPPLSITRNEACLHGSSLNKQVADGWLMLLPKQVAHAWLSRCLMLASSHAACMQTQSCCMERGVGVGHERCERGVWHEEVPASSFLYAKRRASWPSVARAFTPIPLQTPPTLPLPPAFVRFSRMRLEIATKLPRLFIYLGSGA